MLEIHVDTPDGDHVRSARVELTYNGESNLANTDNKGIAVFYGVPTGTELIPKSRAKALLFLFCILKKHLTTGRRGAII